MGINTCGFNINHTCYFIKIRVKNLNNFNKKNMITTVILTLQVVIIKGQFAGSTGGLLEGSFVGGFDNTFGTFDNDFGNSNQAGMDFGQEINLSLNQSPTTQIYEFSTDLTFGAPSLLAQYFNNTQ